MSKSEMIDYIILVLLIVEIAIDLCCGKMRRGICIYMRGARLALNPLPCKDGNIEYGLEFEDLGRILYDL